MPPNAVYERARLARDARFDGQFFVGVKSTGIYCRPICPANPPKPENVEYYPSAAAAGEAGFRPCLRCRPECAPGTPAWHGTSTTVRRGLRLIANGALDDGSVEDLAERLGVTSRHLRRLFTRHLGASPLAVAHTQRLHFAKRLIDQTQLPMRDIAVAAGYRSTRRFNDAFRTTYGRAPRELRRHVGNVAAKPSATLAIDLPYRTPFDWTALLGFFAARAVPGVEAVSDGVYHRTVGTGTIVVCDCPDARALRLSVAGVGTPDLFAVVQKVREIFDLDAPVGEIRKVLVRDPMLKRALGRRAVVRVPGTWDPFELSVRAILGQQVSVKAATTLAGRIVERYGSPVAAGAPANLTHVFPGADTLARARLEGLGLTTARAATIRRLAKAVVDGDVSFDAAQDPAGFRASLTALHGIGEWTAQYVAMRALKHPDAFPASDLGLLKAASGDGARVTPKALEARAEAWRPWRAYAALLLWNTLPGSGG